MWNRNKRNNLCCQGGSHVFNFDQSQVKSHEGLAALVCGFCKLMFSTRLIEYSLSSACFWQGPLFFLQVRAFISLCMFLTRSIVSSASLSIHQSVGFLTRSICLLQARVLISPCVFSTSSIVPPGLCSVLSAWFSGKFCTINFCF